MIVPLLTSTAVAATLIFFGWGNDWLTDLALVLGGTYLGHVLTEVMNDPTD